MTTLAFLILELSPFVLLEIDFSKFLSLEYPLEYFDGTWQKCRTGPDDLSLTRMTTLPVLLLALSLFVIFDSDNPLIPLWNIFMTRQRFAYENDNSGFLNFGVISLCFV